MPIESGPETAAAFDLSGALVLVIDDEGAVQEGMAALLRKWQCEVLTAGSGQGDARASSSRCSGCPT